MFSPLYSPNLLIRSEVTKYLVYNARKRQEGGDLASKYFECTANVAGVEDARFQSLMPDVLLWLGSPRLTRSCP